MSGCSCLDFILKRSRGVGGELDVKKNVEWMCNVLTLNRKQRQYKHLVYVPKHSGNINILVEAHTTLPL